MSEKYGRVNSNNSDNPLTYRPTDGGKNLRRNYLEAILNRSEFRIGILSELLFLDTIQYYFKPLFWTTPLQHYSSIIGKKKMFYCSCSF